jgi:DNA-directed RNA polymerase specialized sigma24 family protein
MSELLSGLGLTKDFVQDSFGVEFETEGVELKKNYLFVDDQKRIRKRLTDYEKFIIARFLDGLEPVVISQIVGVSEESIRSRLRKAKLFSSTGPGRPSKTQTRPIFL